MLQTKDSETQKQAVEQLEEFALRGRVNAQLLLERILTPAKSDAWRFGPTVRFATAVSLGRYGERRGNPLDF